MKFHNYNEKQSLSASANVTHAERIASQRFADAQVEVRWNGQDLRATMYETLSECYARLEVEV